MHPTDLRCSTDRVEAKKSCTHTDRTVEGGEAKHIFGMPLRGPSSEPPQHLVGVHTASQTAVDRVKGLCDQYENLSQHESILHDILHKLVREEASVMDAIGGLEEQQPQRANDTTAQEREAQQRLEAALFDGSSDDDSSTNNDQEKGG